MRGGEGGRGRVVGEGGRGGWPADQRLRGRCHGCVLADGTLRQSTMPLALLQPVAPARMPADHTIDCQQSEHAAAIHGRKRASSPDRDAGDRATRRDPCRGPAGAEHAAA